jgi:hypothetical protein
MSKLGRYRMIGVCLAAAALLAGPVALFAGRLETGKTFQVPDNCRIVTPDDRHATLADIKVGDVVHIRYRNTNGTLIADRIVVRSLDTAPPSENPKRSGKAPPPPEPGNENVRATIINVNLRARTISIVSRGRNKAE